MGDVALITLGGDIRITVFGSRGAKKAPLK